MMHRKLALLLVLGLGLSLAFAGYLYAIKVAQSEITEARPYGQTYHFLVP
jgi:hypothetical protein